MFILCIYVMDVVVVHDYRRIPVLEQLLLAEVYVWRALTIYNENGFIPGDILQRWTNRTDELFEKYSFYSFEREKYPTD